VSICSLLLYAADTWILLSADVRTLDAFRQKCLRQLLGIRLYDRVQNNDSANQRTGLTSLSHLLSRRRISVFGHVARLYDNTPANMALQLHSPHQLITQPTSWPHVASSICTWSSTQQVARTATKRFHTTIPHVRLETSGDKLSTVDMVVQRCNGPRLLRELDDN